MNMTTRVYKRYFYKKTISNDQDWEFYKQKYTEIYMTLIEYSFTTCIYDIYPMKQMNKQLTGKNFDMHIIYKIVYPDTQKGLVQLNWNFTDEEYAPEIGMYLSIFINGCYFFLVV